MFRVTPGVVRRRCQGAIVALCLVTGLSLWLTDGAFVVPGWAGWLAQAMLAVIAWLGWRALAWPSARAGYIQVVAGRWFLSFSADHPREQALFSSPGQLAVLPGLLIIPWRSGRRLWVFSDECSAEAWRRLNLCARFSWPASRSRRALDRRPPDHPAH